MTAMNAESGSNTPPRRPAAPAARGEWWKAWVLLTGLGATVFGWMALPRDAPSTATDRPSPQVSAAAESVTPAAGPQTRVRQRSVTNSVRGLPGLPQKPVFQAPITRTRRS